MVNLETLGLLGAGAGLAGFVDTLAGGGGLITLPLLLLAGVPPLQALATNKLQGTFGTLSATATLLVRRQIFFGEIEVGFAIAFIGGLLGALGARTLGAGMLDILIPFVLSGIACYFLLAPTAAEVGGQARMSRPAYLASVVPTIGFYDGFFGPGTGSFFALAGVGLRGETLLKATAFAKVLNFGSNFGALVTFLASGKVVWAYGAVMICGQVLGATAGSHVMIRGGPRLIRPLIVAVCFIMIVRYAGQKGYLAWFYEVGN